jgi:hypothetical protein
MLRRLLLLVSVVVTLPAAASDVPFRPVATPVEAARLSPTTIRAAALHPFSFDARLFAEAVRGVAVERPSEVGTPSTFLELPHPDGGLALFRVIESPVMAPELAAKFLEIRTFRGEGVDDPTASVRFDVSPRGFSAMVLSAFGAHGDLLRRREDEGQQRDAASLDVRRSRARHGEERFGRPDPPHRRRERLLQVAAPFTPPGGPAAPPG